MSIKRMHKKALVLLLIIIFINTVSAYQIIKEDTIEKIKNENNQIVSTIENNERSLSEILSRDYHNVSQVYVNSIVDINILAYTHIAEPFILYKSERIIIQNMTKIQNYMDYARYVISYRINTSKAGYFEDEIRIGTDRGEANYKVYSEIINKSSNMKILLTQTPFVGVFGVSEVPNWNRIVIENKLNVDYLSTGIGYKRVADLPDLKKYDLVILKGDALTKITDNNVEKIQKYISEGGSVLIFQEANYVGTTEGTSKIIRNYGFKETGTWYIDWSDNGRLINKTDIVNDPITEGINQLRFKGDNPIMGISSINQKILVKLFNGGMVIAGKINDNGKIVLITSQSFEPFLNDAPDNPLLIENIILKNPDIMYQNPIKIIPSISYSQENQRFAIQAYIYNKEEGYEITTGTASYKILKDEELVYTNNLSYTNVWEHSKKIQLEKGIYEILINYNGYIYTQNLRIGNNQSRVYGNIYDENNSLQDSVNISIYNFENYPENPMISSRLDYSYSFSLTPGTYIITAKRRNLEATTTAFTITGDEELEKNIILTSERNVKLALLELKKAYENKIKEDTKKLVNLTSLASKDLDNYETQEPLEYFKKAILKEKLPEIQDFMNFLKNEALSIIKKASYGKMVETLVNDTKQQIDRLPFRNEKIATYAWLVNNTNGVKARSISDIKDDMTYKRNIEEINESYKWFNIDEANISFDLAKARKIIGDQITQLESKSNNIILPEIEKRDLISWRLENSYNRYLSDHEKIIFEAKGKKVYENVLLIGKILVVISNVVTGGSTTAITVAVVKLGALESTVNIVLGTIRFIGKMRATEDYAFAVADWIIDTTKANLAYEKTIAYLMKESQNPYYLDKDRNFKAKIDITLYPDEIIEGKNYYYNEFDLLEKTATVDIENLEDKADQRVLVESKIEEKNKFKVLSYTYFNHSLNKGESFRENINFTGLNQVTSRIFEPQVLIAQLFTGPFQTSIDLEYFYILPQWARIVSNTRGIITTSEKELSVRDIQELSSELTEQNNINLNKENKEYEFNYTVSEESYGVKFQLFYEQGNDVDLYVDYNNSYIGYNEETGESQIGFPGYYSGKYEYPEIINIPDATSKKYTIKAILKKENTNLSVPIKITTIEEPFRPAILSVYTIENTDAYLNENIALACIISEAGKQKPIENISLSLKINNLTNSTYNLKKLNAGEEQAVLFNILSDKKGEYNGNITINSTAGNVILPIFLNITEIIYNNSNNETNNNTEENNETNYTFEICDRIDNDNDTLIDENCDNDGDLYFNPDMQCNNSFYSFSKEYFIDAYTSPIIKFEKGWNQLAFPIKNNISLSSFPYCVHKTAYLYNKTGYQEVKEVSNGKGYWIYAYVNCSFDISKYGLINYTKINLEDGWNIVPQPSNSDYSNVYPKTSGLWEWNSTTEYYQTPIIKDSKKSLWIYWNNSLELSCSRKDINDSDSLINMIQPIIGRIRGELNTNVSLDIISPQISEKYYRGDNLIIKTNVEFDLGLNSITGNIILPDSSTQEIKLIKPLNSENKLPSIDKIVQNYSALYNLVQKGNYNLNLYIEDLNGKKINKSITITAYPKYKAVCKQQWKTDWKTKNSKTYCGKDEFIKYETKKILRTKYYRQICEKTIESSCSVNPSCSAGKLQYRQEC